MNILFAVIALSISLAVAASAEPIIKVSAVQMRSSLNLEENVQKISRFLETLSAGGVKIAVFPECALTSYTAEAIKNLDRPALEKAIDSVAEACRKHKICAVIGTPTYRPDGKLFNTALVFDEEGTIVERYHKVQLVETWAQPGDHLALFDIAGVKATIIICHDERYPELVRLPVMAGARLVFYVSSESGIREEHKINPYRAQIQARAMENTVWVVHANTPANNDLTGSHGQSRIIQPDGNIVKEASMFGEEVVTADLDMARSTGWLARRSRDCAFLRDFWDEGLKLFDKN